MERDDKYNRSRKGVARTRRYRNSLRGRNAQRNRVLARREAACKRCRGVVRHSPECLREYERDYRQKA